MDYRLYLQLKWAVSHGQKERIKSLLQEGAPVDPSTETFDYRPPLLSSVYSGDPEIVEMLLTKGASANVKHFNNETALMIAAKIGKYAIADLLLMADGLKNCKNHDNLTHLHIACMRNNVEVVKKLIKSKKHVNAAVETRSLYWPGFTPLHFAVQFGCVETVEYLLSIGADITVKDGRQLTPLHLADMQRNEPILDLILLAHMNVVSNPKNSQDLSHFHIACTRNNPEVVEFFLKIGVDLQKSISSCENSCSTAMDLAMYYECTDVVRLLLLHGEHVKSDIYFEIDRVEDAYCSGNEEIVNLLLTNKKLLQGKSTKIEKMPDLHIACMRGDSAKVRECLSESPDSLNSPWNGRIPLHLAVEHRKDKIVKLLMKQGANFLTKNHQGKTPLHVAFESDVDFVNFILEDLDHIEGNPIDSNGLSHLHIFCTNSAIHKKRPSVIEEFIRLGSDVNSPVSLNSAFWPGFTPLHFAAKFKCDEVVQILLSNGACYAAVDRSGLSPFDWCIKKTYTRWEDDRKAALNIMRTILLFHSQHNSYTFDDHGYSILHLLCLSPKTKMKTMKDFIDKNPSDLNKAISLQGSTHDGYTPLHLAMRLGYQKHAELLLEMGADILHRSTNGDTPLHLAFETKYNSIQIPMNLQDSNILQLNPMGSTGYSLFHIACGMGSIETMRSFLQHGIDVNLPTMLKNVGLPDKKPLHMVIRYDPFASVEAVEFLLDNGADIFARDSQMNTPLHEMAGNSNAQIIDLLVSRGADINALNAYFETPILKVSEQPGAMVDEVVAERMALFFNNGADINLVDEKGETPLTAPIWTMEPDHFVKTADTLLKHVLRLECLRFYVSDENKKGYFELLRKFSDKIQFNEIDFTDRCFKESERMSEVYVANRTTLRDILSKSPNELAVISENNMFLQTISAYDFLEKFPIYGPMLQSLLRRGRARRPLLRQAQKALDFLSGVLLPGDCTERILQTFSNEDLHFVISSLVTPRS